MGKIIEVTDRLSIEILSSADANNPLLHIFMPAEPEREGLIIYLSE